MSEKIIAYKAMDKNMMCRGKQYEVGKTYHEDKADCCRAGMHAHQRKRLLYPQKWRVCGG
jgi:hypothetical protein